MNLYIVLPIHIARKLFNLKPYRFELSHVHNRNESSRIETSLLAVCLFDKTDSNRIENDMIMT